MPTAKDGLSRALDFLRISGMLPAANPGYAHVLKSTYHMLDHSRLSFDPEKRLFSYRFPFPVNGHLRPTAGVLMGLMDELSNTGIVASKMISPGVSLSLQLELLKSIEDHKEPMEIDIRNTTTQLGRSVGFTKTEFVDTATDELIAFGSQVKYLPVGHWLSVRVMNSDSAMKLIRKYLLRDRVPECYPERGIQEILDETVTYHEESGKATLQVTGESANQLGIIHVSCGWWRSADSIGPRKSVDDNKSRCCGFTL